MARLIIKRLPWIPPIMWATGTITFLLMHLAPGNPWVGQEVSGVLGEPRYQWEWAIRDHAYGFDRPLPVQYIDYWWHVVRGDLGMSTLYQQTTVSEVLLRALPYSLALGVLAMLLAIAVSVPLGLLTAQRHGGWLDRLTVLTSAGAYALPSFVVGIASIVVFCVHLRWLPVLYVGPSSYILPVIVLALAPASFLCRLIRASTLQVLGTDYVRTARGKGLAPVRVSWWHVTRNALIPASTLLGSIGASLIAGSVIVEKVFNIPGFGSTFVQAVATRDYPLIMGGSLLYALLVVLANLVADVCTAALDPRILA